MIKMTKTEEALFESLKLQVAAQQVTVREAAATLGWTITRFYRNFQRDEIAWTAYTKREGRRGGRKTLSYAEHVANRAHHLEDWRKRLMAISQNEMETIRKKSRLAEHCRAARALGMTYGYYMALVIEGRGRL